MSTEDMLKTVQMFSELDSKQIGSLAKLAHERKFAAGDEIVSEGDSGIGLYLIVSGEVEVVRGKPGQETRIRRMGPGDSFGELALLTNHPRVATVRAVAPTSCLVITSVTFQGLLTSSPEVGRYVSKSVATRLVEAEERAQTA